jgi:carbonic anhydrase
MILVALLAGSICLWRLNHSTALDAAAAWPHDSPSALAELRNGNERFVKSARTISCDTGHDGVNRHQTAPDQHPFVAIVCCADSRVCPEFIFDLRAGSVFEIRNAGNVVDDDVLASLEYAVEHLHVPLILVMAHKGCGAIQAVYEAHGKTLPGHLGELQKHIAIALPQGIDQDAQPRAELLNQFSKENAEAQAAILLRTSDVIKTAVDNRQVRVLYGIYDMETGSVDFFDLE